MLDNDRKYHARGPEEVGLKGYSQVTAKVFSHSNPQLPVYAEVFSFDQTVGWEPNWLIGSATFIPVCIAGCAQLGLLDLLDLSLLRWMATRAHPVIVSPTIRRKSTEFSYDCYTLAEQAWYLLSLKTYVSTWMLEDFPQVFASPFGSHPSFVVKVQKVYSVCFDSKLQPALSLCSPLRQPTSAMTLPSP